MHLEMAKLEIELRHRDSDRRALARLARTDRSTSKTKLLRRIARTRIRIVTPAA